MPAVPSAPRGVSAGADEASVRAALREVIDPEIGINVVDLGLVYRVVVEHGDVAVDLALTTPACPLGGLLREEAEMAIRRRAPGAGRVDVRLVNSPPWGPERMSPEAKRTLGWGGAD